MRHRLKLRAAFAWAVTLTAPALCIGGIDSRLIPLFFVIAWSWFLWIHRRRRIRVPRGLEIFGVAIAATIIQWIPGGAWLRPGLAPRLQLVFEDLSAVGMSLEGLSFSPTPGDTALETIRLCTLALIFFVAAQFHWRRTAMAISIAGTCVAVIGGLHHAISNGAILGFYRPRDVDLSHAKVLVTTFVNSNHQSALFLLGGCCALALAIDFRQRAIDGHKLDADFQAVDRLHDRVYASVAAVVLQWSALVLSLSRGALLVLILIAPLLLWLTLGGQQRQSKGVRSQARRFFSLRRVVLVLVVGLLFLFLAQRRAWAELKTLLIWSDPKVAIEMEAKVRGILDAFELISFSPWIGIGRGAYIDLFPFVDSDPSGVLSTHLESYPVVQLVEFGWVFGLAIVFLSLRWLTQTGRALPALSSEGGVPQAVLYVGLWSVVLQNFVDFNLEFLGVGIPLAAIAGALATTHRSRGTLNSERRSKKTIGLIYMPLAVVGLVISIAVQPFVVQRRPEQISQVRRGSKSLEELVWMRPLDGRLYLAGAFAALQSGDRMRAEELAKSAAGLLPESVDARWIQAAVLHSEGRRSDAEKMLAQALERLHGPLPKESVQDLLQRVPDADRLAAIAPSKTVAWKALVVSIRRHAPNRLDILEGLAAARMRSFAEDFDATYLRYEVAIKRGDSALSRHYSRLLVGIAPEKVSSHLAVADALWRSKPPMHQQSADYLQKVLDEGPLEAANDLARIEENLVQRLISIASPDSLKQAEQLMPRLLRRPANAAQRRYRNHLRRQLQSPKNKNRK